MLNYVLIYDFLKVIKILKCVLDKKNMICMVENLNRFLLNINIWNMVMFFVFSIYIDFKLLKYILILVMFIECYVILEVCKEIKYCINNKICLNLVFGLCKIFD